MKIKFVCSYGGRLVLREGNICYSGGETRIIAVERSIRFAELSLKLAEMYGGSLVNLRCKLPKEDLDVLVSITSDEDLQNLLELYEKKGSPDVQTELKIKAFLYPWQPKQRTTLPPSRLGGFTAATTTGKDHMCRSAARLPPRPPAVRLHQTQVDVTSSTVGKICITYKTDWKTVRNIERTT